MPYTAYVNLSMSSWVAACLWACIILSSSRAQQLLSPDEPNMITLRAGECQGYMIGSASPERGTYVVNVAPAGSSVRLGHIYRLRSFPSAVPPPTLKLERVLHHH